MKRFILLITLWLGTQSFSMDATVCTNNKQVNSYVEYLEEFSKGPCSTFMLLTGFMSSNLRVVVDCPTFKAHREEYPEIQEILKQCNFLCRGRQKRYENTLWMSDKSQAYYFFMNDFNIMWKRRQCFIKMYTVYRKKVQVGGEDGIKADYKYEIKDLPGFEVKLWGNTEETYTESECGTRNVEKVFAGNSVGYSMLLNLLKSMGYVSGITLQVVPYDFRKMVYENKTAEKIRLGLRIMNTFTGKRAMMIGHSYGNNIVMNGLKNLTQTERDLLVDQYWALGGPFLGTNGATMYLGGQNNWMYLASSKQKLHFDWVAKYFDGINPTLSKMLYPYINSMYEFIPMSEQLDAAWKTYQQRKGTLQDAKVPQVLLDQLENQVQKRLYQAVFTKEYGDLRDKRDFMYTDMDGIIQEFGFDPAVNDIYQQIPFERLRIDQNPGVEVNVVFFKEVATTIQISAYENIPEAFSQNRFPLMAPRMGKGDRVVELLSLILSPMNWLSEYLQTKSNVESELSQVQEDTNPPKKIHFYELGPDSDSDKTPSEHYDYIYCHDDPSQSSKYENLERLFGYKHKEPETKTEDMLETLSSILETVKNSVMGISKSESRSVKFGGTYNLDFGTGTCNHSGVITNKQFLELFLSKILTRYENNPVEPVSFGDISDDVFDTYVLGCPVVRCGKDYDQCWSDFKEQFHQG